MDTPSLALRLCAALALAACASPSPEFFGAERRSVVQDGVTVEVFWTDRRAQAIRMGYATRAEQRGMPGVLGRAIETATGCALRPGTLQGDSGVVTGAIDCRSTTTP